MDYHKILESLGRGLIKIFGSRNERELNKLRPLVARVNELEESARALGDGGLKVRSAELRQRARNGEPLDDVLPEAFALVREAGRRFVKMRHFDVQILGGIVLHRGAIAEMVTGEGKTLVATLAAFLNALPGDGGVHVVTVNDYLARRDREWMGPIYEGLGMTVGAIQSPMDSLQRKPEYACDITYGTNNEFGFDYLRDNMKVRVEDQVQGRLKYAIIDEVDSILVDEARTPLIISGPAEESTEKYYQSDRIARKLEKGRDFEVKEKENSAILTEEGIETAQKLAGVETFYSGRNMDWPHHIEQALRAHHLYKRDVEYVVKDREIIIVDEFTGRLMPGRRWSDGLHQAIEAKEHLKIKEENQTLATITFQNYFRLYKKIAGMTGTAVTEAAEFDRIYKLDVLVIPTNKPLIRKSYNDVVYRTRREKFNSIVEEIVELHKKGRPVLVGTISIETSEMLSGMLERRGIPHEVLNAKHHEREAQIIAKAGQKGMVTIATNMAGRGTDIILGEGVKDLDGLHILGTERHEARRIDNQLRGRSGRQGDPGSSQFFLSLEDDLMRVFASEKVSYILGKIGMKEGQDIQSSLVNRAIERAQKKVETHNFEIRKNLLEYDEVMNEQRKLVYEQRQAVLQGQDLTEMVLDMTEQIVQRGMEHYLAEKEPGPKNFQEFSSWFRRKFGVSMGAGEIQGIQKEKLVPALMGRVKSLYERREKEIGSEDMRRIERFLLLNAIDSKWKDHLHAMDGLKSGIGLRAFGNVDPKVEYKMEGYRMFEQMIRSIQEEVTEFIFKIRIEREEEDLESIWAASSYEHDQMAMYQAGRAQQERAIAGSQTGEGKLEPIRAEAKVGRNAPCPCGSGKKYKKCCGRG